jgi:hypothetical protein
MPKKTKTMYVTIKRDTHFNRKLEMPIDAEWEDIRDLAEVNFSKEKVEWDEEVNRTFEVIDAFEINNKE